MNVISVFKEPSGKNKYKKKVHTSKSLKFFSLVSVKKSSWTFWFNELNMELSRDVWILEVLKNNFCWNYSLLIYIFIIFPQQIITKNLRIWDKWGPVINSLVNAIQLVRKPRKCRFYPITFWNHLFLVI